MTTKTIDEIGDAVAAAMPPVSAAERGLVEATYRALLAGDADITSIADRAGWDRADAAQRLRSWPAVFFDGDRVVGFWGLSPRPVSPHRVDVGEATAWGWCAADPLFILPLLGESGTVHSTCAQTGRPITVQIGPDGDVTSAPDVRVSFLVPDGPFDSDVQSKFCHYILFFADPAAVDEWIAGHDGTIALTVPDAVRIGQRLTAHLNAGGG